MKRQKPTPQGESFKKLARELGADMTQAEFDKALGKIGRATPQPKAKKRKPLKLALR